MAFEERLDAGALMTAAAPVNQAHFAQAGGVCGNQVFVDERRNVSRRETVKIENRFYREPDRFGTVLIHDRDRSWSCRGLRVGGLHERFDAAAGREIADHGHALRGAHGDQIVEDLVRDRLVEDALVPEVEQVVASAPSARCTGDQVCK